MELVIIGEEDIGKTTLANALLGWDILPQTNDDRHAHTEENVSRMLTDSIRLTDTPGFDLLWQQVPEAVNEAVANADTIILMCKDLGDLTDVDMEYAEPEEAAEILRWRKKLTAKVELQKSLLARANTRDIYFVLPFYSEDGPFEPWEPEWELQFARAHFAGLSAHGENGFFCIDPMMALIGAIEDDRETLAASGILPLKEALLKEKE